MRQKSGKDNPWPCWPQIVVDFSEVQRWTSEKSATIAKDFEGLVLDRTQLGKDRAVVNHATFEVLADSNRAVLWRTR